MLQQLPVAERIAFALRHIDGLELTEVAAACDVSLATIKRRLSRAQASFTTLAQRSPSLSAYLEQGAARWIHR